MIVYKLRDKKSGQFLNRSGHISYRGGTVYTSIGHIKTSYKFSSRSEDIEVVECQVSETGKVVTLKDIL